MDFDKEGTDVFVVSTDGFAKIPLYCPQCKIHLGEIRIQHDIITVDNIEYTCRICGTKGHGKDLWAESIDMKEKKEQIGGKSDFDYDKAKLLAEFEEQQEKEKRELGTITESGPGVKDFGESGL